MKAVESGERGEEPDHVFGFPERTARPQPVAGGESFGKRAVKFGFAAVSTTVALELPVEAGIGCPGGTGLLDSPPEIIDRVGVGISPTRATGGGPGLSRQRVEQPSLGAELVVNSDP